MLLLEDCFIYSRALSASFWRSIFESTLFMSPASFIPFTVPFPAAIAWNYLSETLRSLARGSSITGFGRGLSN
ncbi:MAG: hypothetical protein J6U56_07075 [Spirochaetia bacterium]|nr:hypothetical protein [Spirochaetia bacterium]